MTESRSFGGVFQQPGQRRFQPRFIGNLHGGVGLHKIWCNVGEVLHVRAEDHRLAESGRFNGVLSALCGETLAHEGNVGPGVEVAEFTGGVDQQAF